MKHRNYSDVFLGSDYVQSLPLQAVFIQIAKIHCVRKRLFSDFDIENNHVHQLQHTFTSCKQVFTFKFG